MPYAAFKSLVDELNSAIVAARVDGQRQYIGYAVPVDPVQVCPPNQEAFDLEIDDTLSRKPQYIMAYRNVNDELLVAEARIFIDKEYAAGYADGSGVGWYYDLHNKRMIMLRRARI